MSPQELLDKVLSMDTAFKYVQPGFFEHPKAAAEFNYDNLKAAIEDFKRLERPDPFAQYLGLNRLPRYTWR